MWICHSDLVINSIDAVSANVCVKYASDALDFIWCIYTTCRKMKRIVVKVFIHEFVSWWNMLETLKPEYAHCTLTHTLEFAGARICCALHEKKLLCLHISKIHITSKRQMPLGDFIFNSNTPWNTFFGVCIVAISTRDLQSLCNTDFNCDTSSSW